MRAIIGGMSDASPSQRLISDETAATPATVHAWLTQEQQRLGDIVGEPLFVTIRLIYDGSVEVEVETFTDRHGMAAGDSLPETWQAAVETLLVLDEIRATLV